MESERLSCGSSLSKDGCRLHLIPMESIARAIHLQHHCPDCGRLRHSKGSHHIAFRTVFGTIPVETGFRLY